MVFHQMICYYHGIVSANYFLDSLIRMLLNIALEHFIISLNYNETFACVFHLLQ